MLSLYYYFYIQAQNWLSYFSGYAMGKLIFNEIFKIHIDTDGSVICQFQIQRYIGITMMLWPFRMHTLASICFTFKLNWMSLLFKCFPDFRYLSLFKLHKTRKIILNGVVNVSQQRMSSLKYITNTSLYDHYLISREALAFVVFNDLDM